MRDHLMLRLICLGPKGEWSHKQAGLAFLFLKEGLANYTAGRVTLRLEPGDVLVSNAGKHGRLSVEGSGGAVFSCFFLTLEHLFPLFAAEEVSLLSHMTATIAVPRLYRASHPIAEESQQLVRDVPAEHDLHHRSQLLRVAASLLSEEFRTARREREGGARTEERTRRALATLSADEVLGGSVGELAARFACSQRQLNRVFHQYFGFSVAALRMELRMLRAVSLLRDPDAKVSNVAEQCGFNHLGLFNICFKKRFGTSPTAWRRQTIEAKEQSVGPTIALRCPILAKGICTPGGKNGTHTADETRALDFVLRPNSSGREAKAGTGFSGHKG